MRYEKPLLPEDIQNMINDAKKNQRVENLRSGNIDPESPRIYKEQGRYNQKQIQRDHPDYEDKSDKK